MKKNKAFTLVELLVVVTILAILWTIAFISLMWYSNDARKSKARYNMTNLNAAMEVYLSKGEDIDWILETNRTSINWINTWYTISSGAYRVWNLKYEVGTFNFKKLRINWADFKYEINWEKKDYLFWYIRTPKKIYYEYASELENQWWKHIAFIVWKYFPLNATDAPWLISEKNFDIWLIDWQALTWSLY
jgi:prepilin-type N-terminal cleavage/methylation domain-containing protein